jgi:serine/threonine protein kinase
VLIPEPHWWIKLADFGFSKRTDEGSLRSFAGTRDYVAPEVLGFYYDGIDGSRRVTTAVDVWAAGIVAFRALSCSFPFTDVPALSDYILHGNPFARHATISNEAHGFINRLIAASPANRPTAEQAADLTWLMLPTAASAPTSLRSRISNLSGPFWTAGVNPFLAPR